MAVEPKKSPLMRDTCLYQFLGTDKEPVFNLKLIHFKAFQMMVNIDIATGRVNHFRQKTLLKLNLLPAINKINNLPVQAIPSHGAIFIILRPH
jgi:hypothetical protein